IDFVEEKSMLKRLGEYRNLVVLQTFSKAWGLAGLRLGLAFAHPGVISYMNKIKYPYNVNSGTQEYALKALDNIEKKNRMVAEILKQRERLAREFENMDIALKVYPSDANFLLVKFEEPRKIYDYLLEERIIVRDRSNVVLCEGCLRITVGTE